ncbi:MAG: sulfotransferase [Desulfobacteraceae bacterium]|nr:MAG: sulfotransferase [Desulfobacteraceae bacterium]
MKPIFILGVARSGTNLLARVLNRNPSVTVALDPFQPLFRSLRNALVAFHAPERIRRWFSPTTPFQDFYFHPDGPILLDIMLSGEAGFPLGNEELSILQPKIAERAALESPELARRLRTLEGEDYAQLLWNGFNIIAGMSPRTMWAGCKEVWIVDFLPLLARAFPQARFYFIERDPRAIVASLLALSRKDPTQAAHVPSYLRHWRKNIALTRRFQADPVLCKRFTLVSYEQFVAEPSSVAMRICDELGIEFSPAMLELTADGWRGNSSFNHEGRDIYTHTVNRWREILPEQVVQAADFLCGPEMMLTNYQPAAEPSPEKALSFIMEANKNPGSWRSDNADLSVDFGGELIRHFFLQSNEIHDEQLIRRCFLFCDTLQKIRRAGR